MISVSSQDESIAKLKTSSDDKEKLLRTQLQDIQVKSKDRINELTSQIDQLQIELTRKSTEFEKVTNLLQVANKLNQDQKSTLDQVRLELESEIAQNQVSIPLDRYQYSSILR